MAPMVPSTDPPPFFFYYYLSVSLPNLLSFNPYGLQSTSGPSLLRLGSHRSHLDTRSSNFSNPTTASTKAFLKALALNGIISSVEIVTFTLVGRMPMGKMHAHAVDDGSGFKTIGGIAVI